MNAREIFEYYSSARVLSSEGRLDFVSWVQDAPDTMKGSMAVAGISLSMIEHGWDEDKVRLLASVVNADNVLRIRQRAMAGLLLVLMNNDGWVRRAVDTPLMEDVQDAFAVDPSLALATLLSLLRTDKVDWVESAEMALSREMIPLLQAGKQEEANAVVERHKDEIMRVEKLQLDRTFLLFKRFYDSPFFRECAANWLLPWDDRALQNADADDRAALQHLFSAVKMCDSDRYAFLCSPLRQAVSQIPAAGLSGMSSERPSGKKGSKFETDNYIQQLYRYFRLSSFTQVRPFEGVKNLRDTLVYRLVVVGEAAQRQAAAFFS